MRDIMQQIRGAVQEGNRLNTRGLQVRYGGDTGTEMMEFHPCEMRHMKWILPALERIVYEVEHMVRKMLSGLKDVPIQRLTQPGALRFTSHGLKNDIKLKETIEWVSAIMDRSISVSEVKYLG